MKILFDFLVSFWSITENSILNWLIIGFMAPIVFVLAFKFTGEVSHIVGYNSSVMSVLHWLIRAIIYFLFVCLLKGIIYFISIPIKVLNISNPKTISVFIVLISIVVLSLYVKNNSNLRYRVFKK